MAYGKIAYINNQGNFSLILQRGFSYWLKKIKSFLILPILILVVFILVNTDLESLKYSVMVYFKADSIRKMDVPQEWISKYNIVLTNKISIKSDGDADGLTFQEEAQYGINPFVDDTDGDGINDGDEIRAGTNPLGNGELDSDQDEMPDKWETKYGLLVNSKDAEQDADKDGLTNIEEYLHDTDPKNPDTDGDGYTDLQEIKNGYDPNAPGDARPSVTILSEKIGLAVPMIWSQSAEQISLQKDLEKGVVHYPKSGTPGEAGNAIISGHSSNYAWAKGDYNSIFKNLNNLSAGDVVVVRVVQQNGKTFDYKYQITEKKILDASDEWIFQDFASVQILTLSTCWPIGTDISRLVVRAERVADSV